MDEELAGYMRDLIDAIRAAVDRDPGIQACRARARAAGHDLRLSLEAVVGVAGRAGSAARAAAVRPPSQPSPKAPAVYPITEADRRFLRSLRIASNETASEEV
jgi:hypothetical protein